MLYNVIGSIIRAITIIVLWVIFVEYYEIIIKHIWKVMLFIFFIVWIYIYKYKRKEFITYMKEKNDELDKIGNKK